MEGGLVYNANAVNASGLIPHKSPSSNSPIPTGGTYTSLADLKGKTVDEVLLTEKMQEDMMKPLSTRIKVVVEYDEKTKKYILTDKDQKVLKDYNI